MKAGDCPSCRAPVEFAPGGGKVKVCSYCHTVVLYGDAKLENLGKVADLVDTNSPLKVGLNGRYSGTPFTIAGRIQKQNPTGTWDEWCLSFEDGRVGWLSESEGEWNFMFPLSGVQLPTAEQAAPLFTFTLRDKRFVVEERNQATTLAAEGQLPDFNREHTYVDATGPRGVFASLDYGGGTAEAFVGNRVTLADLGFDKHELQPTPRRDALSAARCTQCNGMLDLKAPDSTRRVACPYCGALLEVAHGTLSFLQLLEKPPYDPQLALGSVGALGGTNWTILAFLIRSCVVEGTRYSWDEYLLWNQEKGFTWLMNSQGHWTWLKPVAAGEVMLNERTAMYQGQSYRAFQQVFARTDYVVGECYWTVSVGELARAVEYVAPPKSLNLDQVETEVTFTEGELLKADVISDAFKLKERLLQSTAIASALPNPYAERASSGWKWALVWGGVLLALVVTFSAMGSSATFYQGRFHAALTEASGSPEAQRFSDPFVITRKTPLEITITSAELSNNWEGVSVDLANLDNGEVISVYGENSYYSGVDDGESWSEGSRESSKQTAEVDPGNYVLRTTPSYDPQRGSDYLVEVKGDDGPGACVPLVIFLVLLLVPLYNQMRSSSFETERWGESVFQTQPGSLGEGGGSDDDGSSDDDE